MEILGNFDIKTEILPSRKKQCLFHMTWDLWSWNVAKFEIS